MKEKFEEALDQVVTKENFSGVISIKENNKIIYQRAFGFAERANERLNNIETKFAIASGTKFFTAIAIGKLIDEGKLSLDSKALEYVDYDFPTYDKEVTIRDLLTHTSGIPDYFDEEEIEDFDNFQVGKAWYLMFDPSDYYEVFPQKEMKEKPSETFRYNNSGFVMLAGIVAKVSGMRYVSFVEAILEEIGMNNSGFYPLNRLASNTAIGYVELEDGYRSNVFNLPIVGGGDGGMYTTVEDMYIFWSALFSGTIISKELLEAFIEPYIKESDDDDDTTYYGHGIWMNVNNGKRSHLYIEGCDAGISFRSGILHEEQIEYTVISNTTGGAWGIIDTIIENRKA